MKVIITTIALTSALIAGTASAAAVDQGHLGLGTAFETASHYDSIQQVTVDGVNLDKGEYTNYHVGSK
ncbi:MAG: hypothetical protein OIF57_15195 [Marinobacterium sp.]|nr:hypothetical protein [Marinobacterium sp.]